MLLADFLKQKNKKYLSSFSFCSNRFFIEIYRRGGMLLADFLNQPAILGLKRIDRLQADVIRGLSCIVKYRFPIKLGMTGDKKEIASKARIAVK